ncbi:hypothetical protein BDV98DRAFT_559137 [Pterulicium gracile]|uniref:DUF7704 domain-containing protein n=1 Tax=Pterulicium gracile TaxID=1884261 RepID=A0A5C3R0H2_9AGAR|nr:hypothetical protein BDV98DRAFT_559137 [Pterula gracilis]
MKFLALAGFYNCLFLYLEPISTLTPFLFIHLYPGGAAWFHSELIPPVGGVGSSKLALLDSRTEMAIWQLGNCYILLAMISSLVFRAIRDALPDNPVAQERIVGAALLAYAIADVTHIVASWISLPDSLQLSPLSWNATTHGNITVVVFLFAVRLAWFAGIGRTRYWYGQTSDTSRISKKA